VALYWWTLRRIPESRRSIGSETVVGLTPKRVTNRGFGVRLRSATEPIDDSSSGKFIESMIAAVSQFDNDVRSERTVAGMKAAAEEGRWTFPAPLGYRIVTTNGSSRMEPDPDRAPLVRSAFELFATGTYEQQQVLKKITAKGLRTRRGKASFTKS